MIGLERFSKKAGDDDYPSVIFLEPACGELDENMSRRWSPEQWAECGRANCTHCGPATNPGIYRLVGKHQAPLYRRFRDWLSKGTRDIEPAALTTTEDSGEVVQADIVDKCHASHKAVRSSDASTFDLICDDCGATDNVPGGWGRLAFPCATEVGEIGNVSEIAPTLSVEAESIVNSASVIQVYASCEWDELHDDGKLWIEAIVRETEARTLAAHDHRIASQPSVEREKVLREALAKCVAVERKTLLDVMVHLAAAISLLEKGGKAAKKVAPSNEMFDIMLNDYRKSLARARAHVNARTALATPVVGVGDED